MATKSKPTNKSAFIRSQDSSLSAGQVVDRARAAGLKIGAALVYKVRARARGFSRPRVSASAGARPLSKAAFVRLMPNTPAKVVIAKAKQKGLVITENYVYGVRTADRVAAERRPHASGTGDLGAARRAQGSSVEGLLRAVAAEVGLARAVEILKAERARLDAVLRA